MLIPYPERRATAAQSLEHSWLETHDRPYKMSDEELKGYKEGKVSSEFRKVKGYKNLDPRLR